MRMVSRHLMVPRLVMPGGFAVVLGGVLEMLGRFMVMLCRLF